MQIDEEIERRVRAAFEAVVAHNPADLKVPLSRLSASDLQIAVSYAIYVCGYVVADVLDGELSEDGLAEMAQYAVQDSKDWFDLGEPNTVASFLRAAGSGEVSSPAVPDQEVPGYSFVVGGYLLSHFCADDQLWYEYLDEIWNAALTADS
jgi:hypothetical protein